ncbi:MAG: hypothetical protein WCC90_01590 [Methylocella sp.]
MVRRWGSNRAPAWTLRPVLDFKLPVLNVRSGTNFVADVTLGVGDVVHDYLALGQEAPVQRLSLAPEPGL